VRIVQMNQVDVGLFQFDYDVTWMGFFLDAQDHILSRYGGRDAKSADARLSIAGLKHTMREVLKLPRQVRPAEEHTSLMAQELRASRGRGCMHCHQVWEGLRKREKDEKRFERDSLYVYPPPEQLGLELDVTVGAKIAKVQPGSAADQAGLRAGDLLVNIDKVSIHAQGDVLWALHNAPATGKLRVERLREGKLEPVAVELANGWRKTDLTWRPSMRREKGK
jgi:hypothetical protein